MPNDIDTGSEGVHDIDIGAEGVPAFKELLGKEGIVVPPGNIYEVTRLDRNMLYADGAIKLANVECPNRLKSP